MVLVTQVLTFQTLIFSLIWWIQKVESQLGIKSYLFLSDSLETTVLTDDTYAPNQNINIVVTQIALNFLYFGLNINKSCNISMATAEYINDCDKIIYLVHELPWNLLYLVLQFDKLLSFIQPNISLVLQWNISVAWLRD